MRRHLLTAALALIVHATGCAHQATKLMVSSDSRELRKRAEGEPASSPDKPPIFFLAFDGMNRDLLYDMLRQGELPALAALLGGAGEGVPAAGDKGPTGGQGAAGGGQGVTGSADQGPEARGAGKGKGLFPHAHFDESFLSTLPSTTMVAWTTALTGVGPAEHGVMGNEFFVREDRALACPAPVSFSDANPTLELYNENYLDKLSAAPSVYDRMRETDPEVLVWVALHPFHRGADRLLLAKKTVMAAAFEGFIEVQAKNHLESKHSRKLYEVLDKAAVDEVIQNLDREVLPDVLTLYLSGTDLYAHVAEEGPNEARRTYLKEVLEPQFARLGDKLKARGALEGRWVVISADHGHTQIVYDHVHSLANKDKDVPKLLIQSGFRVRPFKRYVDDKDSFNAVVAYGGATSYLYFADRSGCAGEKDVCDWKQPPRYQEDVLAAAEALYRNNEDGSIVPELKGTIDLILTRPPRPFADADLPFEVYVGGGKTMPVPAYLAQHPHPTYVAVDTRLRDLGAGTHGERAGDIMLIAHNGDRDKPEDRYYFAEPYHSWHGSPSRQDSEIPLIVANSAHESRTIEAYVKRTLGDRPFQQKLTTILLGLRAGELDHARR